METVVRKISQEAARASRHWRVGWGGGGGPDLVSILNFLSTTKPTRAAATPGAVEKTFSSLVPSC